MGKRRSVTSRPGGSSKTVQSERDRSDVNLILRKYMATGILDNMSPRNATYGDFSSGDDFHAVQTRIATAESNFQRLPAKIRSHYANDLGRLVDSITQADQGNEEALAELRHVGLVEPKPTDEPLTAIEIAGVLAERKKAAGAAATPPAPPEPPTIKGGE